MASDSYVFISYARRDGAVVDRIVEEIEKAGLRTWRDTSEISPGENWANAIEKAVFGASAFVYVASAASTHSEWMGRELSAALTQGPGNTLVVPVVVDAHGKSNLPAFLAQYQWVDLETDVDKGIAELVATLNTVLQSGASATPSPTKTKGYAFISYAIEDKEFLNGLKSFLSDHKYAYWDFHENKRDYGMQFHLELEGIIRESEAILCVLSPDWKKSRWTPREFLFAEEIRKPIFLLRAKELEPTLLISGSSNIDFVEDADFGYRELDGKRGQAQFLLSLWHASENAHPYRRHAAAHRPMRSQSLGVLF